MSTAGIAVTADVVSGFQVICVVGAGAWLIYTKRILFAATPKPQRPDAQAAPVDLAARRTG